MAEQDDEVPTRLIGVLECEVEAIFDPAWKFQISRLAPWIQAELNEVVHSDGFQTFIPRVVWLLLGVIGECNRRELN